MVFPKLFSVAILGPEERRGAEGQGRVAAAAGHDPGPGGGPVRGGIGQGSRD